MKYQVITKSANLFYKLANELRARVPLPNEKNCADIVSAISDIINHINNIDHSLDVDNILYSIKKAEYYLDDEPDYILKDKCVLLFSAVFDDVLYILNIVLEIFVLMKLLTASQISNTMNKLNIMHDMGLSSKELKINIEYFDKHFFATEIVSWSNNVLEKLKTIIPHLTELQSYIPGLSEKEQGVFDSWQHIKKQINIIFKIFGSLIIDIKQDNSELLGSISPFINNNIDKIIAMYEPSDEEIIKQTEDLVLSELENTLSEEGIDPNDISDEEYQKRFEEIKKDIEKGKYF